MNLANKIFSNKTISDYEKKIMYMGPDNNMSAANFLLSRLLLDIFIFAVLFIIPKYGLLISILGTGLFHYMYYYFLISIKIKKRYKSLYDEALIFFELLKLSFKETNNIYTSLSIISYKLNNSMARELKKIIIKNKYTEDLNNIFKCFIQTLPNEDVRISLIDLSASSDYLSTLNKIIKNISEKDILVLKQKYNKLPLLLSIGSILIIICIILILIFMPNIINYVK